MGGLGRLSFLVGGNMTLLSVAARMVLRARDAVGEMPGLEAVCDGRALGCESLGCS